MRKERGQAQASAAQHPLADHHREQETAQIAGNPARRVARHDLVKGHRRGNEHQHDQQHHRPDIVPDADVPNQEARRHRQEQRVPRHPRQERPGL